MATTRDIWQGGDGAWDTNGNWSNGAFPGASDKAIFNGTTSVSVTSPPSTTTTNILLLQTDSGYTGNIGSSGNEIDLYVTSVIHKGSGSLWFNNDSTGATNYALIDSPNTTNAATLGGTEITNIIVLGGAVTISASLANAFNLYVFGGTVSVPAGAGADTTNTCNIKGGTVNSHVDFATVTISGGTLNQDTTQIGTLRISGGTANLNFRDATDDNEEISGDCEITGGIVNLTNNAAGNFVIGGDLLVGRGGTIMYDKGQLTVSGQNIAAGGTFMEV